jgi:RNA polymerase sigma factor (sigma-70 family)
VPTDLQRGDEAALYRLHHERLVRVVRRRVGGSPALIEDACSFAWTQLLCHQPPRQPELFGWLCTVAIHEAHRLSRLERRDDRLDIRVAGRGDGTLVRAESVEDTRASIEHQLQARAALARVAQLCPRERELFALQIAGLSYQEIAAATGDSVRTVDRQLRRAHAHVRWARH